MDGSKLLTAWDILSILSEGSQHNRLLRLDFPRYDAPANATLLVNSIEAEEELSRDFTFRVQLISDSAHIAPSTMMAKMATVSMVRNDGSLRYFNGYIAEFRLIEADGGLAFYEMVLKPWLSFTRLTEDCYSFHGRNIEEITEDTFADYLERDWKVRLIGTQPELTCANQYNETDYNHLHRRWEAAGLFYWYEHRADGHTLWLSDDSGMADPIDELEGARPGEIRFRAATGSIEDDSIRKWEAIRRIKPGITSLTSFDYKSSSSNVVTRKSLNRQGDVFAREVYRDTGHGYSTSDEGDALADIRMQGIDADALEFAAEGNERNALPGRCFKLAEHFSADAPYSPTDDDQRNPAKASEFLIVKVKHSASNNYQDGKRKPSHYENKMTCVRSTTRWRPYLGYNSKPHPNPGILTATVVGPKGEDVYTDELGRVKVQFHWDRVGQFDVSSSPWIRVVAPLAGTRLGQQTIPRVKQEVALHFLAGNIDHPIILGGDYNSDNMPPWRLPSERSLMGFRSREFSSGDGKSGGDRCNHLVLDDTNGRIQAQLKSDHQHSQLSLGHITRIDDSAGRKDFRGEGWELATDGWGAARAGRGMLMTTDARVNVGSHIKDMSEAIQRLSSATGLHKSLAEMALHAGAQDEGQQIEVADAVQEQTGTIKGNAGTFPELSEPHLVLSSAAGIGTCSSQSTHISSDEHTALTAGKDLSIAAGDNLFASIRKSFRLFVHKAGMKLVAAAGKVTIEAQSDEIEIIAKKVLALMSEADWVEIRGKKGIRLHGADNVLEIGSKVQFFTSSPVLFNGNLETLAPKSFTQQFKERTAGKFDQEVFFVNANNKPVGKIDYELIKEGSGATKGTTDSSGTTKLQKGDGMERYTIRYKGELP